MRLWHKDLIRYLPRQQLLGQWRECYCIAKSISEKGTPNHILVNKIMDYPIDHFFQYCVEIKQEMTRRNYKCDWQKFRQYFQEERYEFLPIINVFPEWHNEQYLRQCYYNLEEKHDCCGIPEDDWIDIVDNFKERI